MKSLCIIAIGTFVAFGPAESFAQGWKDKIGLTKKGKVKAADLDEVQTIELLGGAQPDDGIISDYHESHLNQIVFSTEKIDPKMINASNTQTEFSINEPIYFSFFLPKSIRNYVIYPLDPNGFNDTYYYDYSFKKWYNGAPFTSDRNSEGIPKINGYGSTLVYVELDGVQITDINFFVKVDFNSTKTAFTGYISPDASEVDPSAEWIELVANLTEGKHTVKMEIAGYEKSSESNVHMTKEVLAKGEFTLTKSAGEKYSPKTGRTWAEYSSRMNDSNLEAKILKAIQDFGNGHNYSEKFEAIKISSPDWVITRTKSINPVITGRYVVAYCRSVWPNGQCKVQRFFFRQNYDGKSYSSVTLCGGVYDFDTPRAIDCD